MLFYGQLIKALVGKFESTKFYSDNNVNEKSSGFGASGCDKERWKGKGGRG